MCNLLIECHLPTVSFLGRRDTISTEATVDREMGDTERETEGEGDEEKVPNSSKTHEVVNIESKNT